MRKAIKTIKGQVTRAYELGKSSRRELELISEGKIRQLDDGTYEVFSREAMNGCGERAVAGDFFKEDRSGFPYPIEREYFLEHHRRIEGDLYEQECKELDVWIAGDGLCEEIEYLIAHKGLVIDPSSSERYFSAPLYGTIESAACDAVIVFYAIERDEKGRIVDVNFNFVARDEFDQTYEWVEK